MWLIPSVMVSGNEVFGSWLDQEGEALMNEISALIEKVTESSDVPSAA